jgi:hypothetical protein
VNQTRPHCVNQMGKTHSKPLAARHGRGTAWARHAMCESALRVAESEGLHKINMHGRGYHACHILPVRPLVLACKNSKTA